MNPFDQQQTLQSKKNKIKMNTNAMHDATENQSNP